MWSSPIPLRWQKVHRITDRRDTDVALAKVEQPDAIDDFADQNLVYRLKDGEAQPAGHHAGKSQPR